MIIVRFQLLTSYVPQGGHFSPRLCNILLTMLPSVLGTVNFYHSQMILNISNLLRISRIESIFKRLLPIVFK